MLLPTFLLIADVVPAGARLQFSFKKQIFQNKRGLEENREISNSLGWRQFWRKCPEGGV